VEWSRSAHEVGRHIRAYDPKPGAWSRVRGTEVKLFGARVAPRSATHAAGDVIAIDAEGAIVACGGGAVRITAMQPAGKRRLAPIEWANGRGIAVGDRFDTGPS
jgi:methionyl-tRNA formyltransferase